MSVANLVLRLRKLDVKVWVEGDQLRLSPEHSLTPELRLELGDAGPELIRFLREHSPEVAEPSAPSIERVPRDTLLPLSFAQQRFWFLSQLGDPAAYSMIAALRLRGPLDLVALEWSLGEIVRRHETLRTTLQLVHGQPTQVIAPTGDPEMTTVDLASLADPIAEAKRLAQAQFDSTFDLTTGPLFRFMLLVLGADDHVLLAPFHHIISDRWSYGVLFHEMSALYSARIKGEPSPLDELRVQYADYACWQRDGYARQRDKHLPYWLEQLRGLPSLELPTDRPRPAVQTYNGMTRQMTIPAGAAADIRALGTAENCTFFMAMLAGFKVLLARYSGQQDIVIGTPIANRPDVDTELMIGPFLNSLVLRTDLSGTPSFRELLQRVRQVALGAYQHQELPFEQLLVELRPERDLSRSPVFQVMFNQLDQALPPSFAGIEVSSLAPDTVTAKLELTVTLEECEEGVITTFEYNTDLFDDATIERMGQHWIALLIAAAQQPDRSVWELPLLTPAEQQLLAAKNRTTQDFGRDMRFFRLFEERVEMSPDATAASCGDESLTYAELNARANRLADYLRRLGGARDVPVGVSVERSLDMLVALLGIMKSGAAYVPLDPAYPNDRMAFIIEDAGIELMVTQESLRGELPDDLPNLVRLDADAEAIAACSDANPEPRSGAEDLAYVIFTSGSTGRPKGVQIEHRALANFLCSMAVRPGMTADDVLVAVTTISFDIAGLELYLPLLVGGQVVIAPRGTESDGRQLAELITSAGASIVQATPATWQLLLESGWSGDPELKALCGGEALPRDLAERILPKCRALWNMYGPTETTIWSLVRKVQSSDGQVPIGDPIANTVLHLLDTHQQPVPIGVPGEVHLGGAGLARGYWHRPNLTARQFVADPFIGDGDARLYKTGDLARYRADGTIEFLGRNDHQVKIRGFRIELGEIEHALAGHPVVKECAVVTQNLSSGTVQLVAYAVLRPGETATVSELRTKLRETLPDYMVPPAFVMLDELPLTPNGKVDRKALGQNRHVEVDRAQTRVAPRTATEKFIADVWQDLLEVDEIGIHDNFFDLGGHSLLAMKVVFKVEKRIGQRVLPIELLLQTLGQFAALCDQRGGGNVTENEVVAANGKGFLRRLGQRFGRLR